METRSPLDPDEALAEILAGAPALSDDGQLTFPLSDGTMASMQEISGDAEPLTERLLAILDEHDLASIGEADGDEYRPEAHDLACRLRAVPEAELDEERVASLVVEVLWHWFAAEDGSPMIEFGITECRPAARQILHVLEDA